MIKITLSDKNYNRMAFYFNSIEEANELIILALKENYSVSIENAAQEMAEAV